MPLQFRKRILCHFDSLALQPTDLNTVCSTVSSTNIAVLSWLLPTSRLQRHVHQRFAVEEVAWDSETGEPYGLLTVVSSQFVPQQTKKSVLDRMFSALRTGGGAAPPVSQVILKTSVIDRQHWHRTSWCFRSILKDKEWGDFPRAVYGLDVQSDAVKIDAASFDLDKNIYTKPYQVSIPADGFTATLEDTGKELLDPSVRTTDGFVDNESALRVIAMHRETISFGHEGVLFRQPVWTSPVVPNLAKLIDFKPGKAICDLFEVSEEEVKESKFFSCCHQQQQEKQQRQPVVAAWLLEGIPNTYVFQCESMIEDENDPSANWTELGEKPLHDRIQKKTMNRYEDFKNEIRQRAYEDMAAEKEFQQQSK